MRLIDADRLLQFIHDSRCADCEEVKADRGGTSCPACQWDDAIMMIETAPTIGDWISVKDRLPEEKESMFAKFYATEMWSRAMWLKESETVLVGVVFPDGGKKTTVGRLRDGKWSTTVSQVIPHTVTHWMPLPEPPEEVSGDA